MSKQLLAPFGFPFTSEAMVDTSVEAGDAADAMGYPVVVKLNGQNIAHKTERGLVRLQLADRGAVKKRLCSCSIWQPLVTEKCSCS